MVSIACKKGTAIVLGALSIVLLTNADEVVTDTVVTITNATARIQTLGGVVYDGVKIKRVDADKIVFAHSKGLATVAFEELPNELRAKYGYSKDKAAAAKKDRELAESLIRERRALASKLETIKRALLLMKVKKTYGSHIPHKNGFIATSEQLYDEEGVPSGGNTSKSGLAYISEVDVRSMAQEEDWSAFVAPVGLEVFNGKRLRQYTANPAEFIKSISGNPTTVERYYQSVKRNYEVHKARTSAMQRDRQRREAEEKSRRHAESLERQMENSFDRLNRGF